MLALEIAGGRQRQVYLPVQCYTAIISAVDMQGPQRRNGSLQSNKIIRFHAEHNLDTLAVDILCGSLSY